MNPSDLEPIRLLIEMRERLARIETKMDTSTEKLALAQIDINDHESRIDKLETLATNNRAQLNIIKWAGGGLVTIGTIFGEQIINYLS